MTKRALWILIAVGVLTASCVYLRVGDGWLQLRGQVVTGDQPAESCILELRLAQTDDLVRMWAIEGSFNLNISVDPRPRNYYVRIWCQGYASSYESPTLKYRQVGTVDLGIIQIDELAVSATVLVVLKIPPTSAPLAPPKGSTRFTTH